jgi:hypothetical protein
MPSRLATLTDECCPEARMGEELEDVGGEGEGAGEDRDRIDEVAFPSRKGGDTFPPRRGTDTSR